MKLWFSRLLRYTLIFSIAVFFFLLGSNIYIIKSTRNQLTSNIELTPHFHTAIVLGTNPNLSNGLPNPYFTFRMQAAYTLYKNKKVDLLIVSGDNSSKLYNEPVAMQQALIAAGIPDSAIFLDYAGLRTFDSMARLKEIFGIDSAIVVSQEFHNQRAVFIANKLSMHVIGYNAEDISHNSDFNINLREYLAKSKALIDFWIGVNPKFRGEQIPLQHLTCRASAE